MRRPGVGASRRAGFRGSFSLPLDPDDATALQTESGVELTTEEPGDNELLKE